MPTVTAAETPTGVTVTIAGWEAFGSGTKVAIYRVVGGVEARVSSIVWPATTWIDPAVAPGTVVSYRADRAVYNDNTSTSAAITMATVATPRVKMLRGGLTAISLDGLSVRPVFPWSRPMTFPDVIGRSAPPWFSDTARREGLTLTAQTSSYAAANALESVLASEPVVLLHLPGERLSDPFAGVVGWSPAPFADRVYAAAAGDPGEWVDWTIACRVVSDPGVLYYGTL